MEEGVNNCCCCQEEQRKVSIWLSLAQLEGIFLQASINGSVSARSAHGGWPRAKMVGMMLQSPALLPVQAKLWMPKGVGL